MTRKLQGVRGRSVQDAVEGRIAITALAKAPDETSQCLARQIAWEFSQKLEAALGKQTKAGGSDGGGNFAWADADGEGQFQQALDLVKYVLSGRNAAAGHSTVVCCMDECEGMGMTLVNMVVGLHDNLGIMCVPNVAGDSGVQATREAELLMLRGSLEALRLS